MMFVSSMFFRLGGLFAIFIFECTWAQTGEQIQLSRPCYTYLEPI